MQVSIEIKFKKDYDGEIKKCNGNFIKKPKKQ